MNNDSKNPTYDVLIKIAYTEYGRTLHCTLSDQKTIIKAFIDSKHDLRHTYILKIINKNYSNEYIPFDNMITCELMVNNEVSEAGLVGHHIEIIKHKKSPIVVYSASLEYEE